MFRWRETPVRDCVKFRTGPVTRPDANSTIVMLFEHTPITKEALAMHHNTWLQHIGSIKPEVITVPGTFNLKMRDLIDWEQAISQITNETIHHWLMENRQARRHKNRLKDESGPLAIWLSRERRVVQPPYGDEDVVNGLKLVDSFLHESMRCLILSQLDNILNANQLGSEMINSTNNVPELRRTVICLHPPQASTRQMLTHRPSNNDIRFV